MSALCISTTLPACGDDEPSPVVNPDDNNGSNDDNNDADMFADLYGYWLNSDNTGAMRIEKGGSNNCKITYYTYNANQLQNFSKYVSTYSGGNSTFVALTPPKADGNCYNVSVTISTKSYTQIVLKEANGQGDHLSSYIFTRVTESEFYDYLTSGGNETPTQGFSKSSFIGIWKVEDHVFELKANGTLGYYWLTSYYADTYRDYSDGTWSYDQKSSKLVLIRQFPSGGEYKTEWTITDVTDNSFTTRQGETATRQSSLPHKEETSQSSQLAGTNWSARIDGDYVELSFKNDGTFTETWAGDKATSTYTELDSNTIMIGDGTVLSNTFGESPFNFELNSNKTKLTLYDSFERLTFTRKQ